MKKKYRNIFFLFGIAAVVIMLLTFDVTWAKVWHDLCTAGWWFVAILALWPVLYMLNTCSWWLILKSSGNVPFSFWWLYKIMVTGFALNSATPGGLVGSEPYKIMELAPRVGGKRASSSVILFTMMHTFCHILFWFSSVFLYLFTEKVDVFMGILLTVVGVLCSLALYFFMVGYRTGFVMNILNLCLHIPFAKRRFRQFREEHSESIEQIDRQITELHSQSRTTFFGTMLLEFVGRIASCLEVYFILMIFHSDVTFLRCILIMAFTSLFANMLFFIPMQVGGREGGFAMSVGKLAIPASYGVFIGIICRVREIIFTAIGMALMKVGNHSESKDNK